VLARGVRVFLRSLGRARTRAEGDELTSKLTFAATESGAAQSSGPGEADGPPLVCVQVPATLTVRLDP